MSTELTPSSSSPTLPRPIFDPFGLEANGTRMLPVLPRYHSTIPLESTLSSHGCKSGAFKKKKYPMPEKPRQKRAVIQDMVRPLKQWLLRHRQNPYPTKSEKMELAIGSNMTLVQVSNWFANARRRLKNVVQDPKCSWSKRLRMYNQFVQGNAELLSIASDDSIWDSNSETEDPDIINVVEESSSKDEAADDAETAQMNQYKKSMLQRYLADADQTLTEATVPKRKRSSPGMDELPKKMSRVAEIHHPRPILPHQINPYPTLMLFPPHPSPSLMPWSFIPSFMANSFGPATLPAPLIPPPSLDFDVINKSSAFQMLNLPQPPPSTTESSKTTRKVKV